MEGVGFFLSCSTFLDLNLILFESKLNGFFPHSNIQPTFQHTESQTNDCTQSLFPFLCYDKNTQPKQLHGEAVVLAYNSL